MGVGQYITAGAVLGWGFFIVLRPTLFLAEWFSLTGLPQGTYRIGGELERWLLLLTISVGLTSGGFITDAGWRLSWPGESILQQLWRLNYDGVILVTSSCYWLAAFVLNLPGLPVALARQSFWPVSALLLVCVPGVGTGESSVLLSFLPVALLWKVSVHDRRREVAL